MAGGVCKSEAHYTGCNRLFTCMHPTPTMFYNTSELSKQAFSIGETYQKRNYFSLIHCVRLRDVTITVEINTLSQ